MPDLQDQPPTAPPSVSANTGNDPLAELFHMSTTAGAGTQDYVAINSVAVVCLFLGFASVLAFLSSIFLVLPVVGLVCGIIALVQIRGSNKTQSGVALAALGLLICVGIGGGRSVYQEVQRLHVSEDERQVAEVMVKLGQLIAAEKYDDAYAMFDDRFKERISASNFAATFRNFGNIPDSGFVRSIEWNKEPMNVQEQSDTGEVFASGMGLFKFEKGPDPRRSVIDFVKTDGQWYVHGIDAIFPTRRQ